MIQKRRGKISAGDLVNIPAGVVHDFSFEPGTQGWVVTVTSELLEEGLHDGEGLRPPLKRPVCVRFTSKIRNLVQSISAEYPTRGIARAHVLWVLSGILAGLVARAIVAKYPTDARAENPLQRRFEAVLETHYSRHLGVADYVGLLAVTPTLLGRVMRQATGQSASAAIEEKIIQEARRILAFSNLGIAEVGYNLGFEEPAHFSRVFKRATAQSPRAFRQNLERRPSRSDLGDPRTVTTSICRSDLGSPSLTARHAHSRSACGLLGWQR